MNVETLLECSAHADLIELAKHCEALADGRPLPRREDFHPSNVRWMMGHLFLVDVLDEEADYYYRLFGTYWQTIFGVDLTGQRLSVLETFGFLTKVRPDYDLVVKSQQPLFHPATLVWPNKETIGYQRLLIPFSGNDGQVSLIVGAARCDTAVEDIILNRGFGLPHLVF